MRQIKTALLAMVATILSGLWLVAPANAETKVIVALGDSLTAGFGLPPQDGFVPRLQAALRAAGRSVTITNAGVSGDTATGGAERVDWSVPDGTDGVIVELGANDMLRGVDPKVTRAALARILDRLAQRRIPAMLVGMRALPNLGEDYARRFEAVYVDLARERGLIFYPFFLEGVAGDRSLNQGDGVHPNAKGVAAMVRAITPTVERFLDQISANRA